MIRISLVIATYNRSRQLAETLSSVVVQDLAPGEWECIVVNNNSRDDTEERFARLAGAHPGLNLRMVRETRQGLSPARNRGLAEARGAVVAIIDDDERICPGFLRAYAEFFEARPDAVAAGGPIVAEYPAGRPAWLSRHVERPIANPMDFGPRIRPFPARRIPGGGNMALRRTATERYGGFDPALGRRGETLTGGEESDLFARLRRGGETLWYLPGAVMHHIIPAEKLTDDYLRRLFLQIGATQRQRARAGGGLGRALLAEGLKWGATLLLCLTLRPAQSRRLLAMRRGITRGLLGRS